jgi:hypothetical protein
MVRIAQCLVLLAFIWAAPAAAAQLSTAGARIADLEVAKSSYVLKSKAFTPQARQHALALIADLEHRAGALSDAQYLIGMMEIAAAAQNGHDSLDIGDGAWTPATRLPLRLIWFPDGIVVARAAPELAGLLGARVVRVEGLTSAQLLARLRPLSGGVDAYRKWNLMWVVENGGMLHALGVAHDPNRLVFDFLLPDGRQVSRTIAFVAKPQLPSGADPARYWSPEPIDTETAHGWRTAIDPARTPLYLADADTLYRASALPELQALYIQFRANWDENGQYIKPFAQSLLSQIESSQPENVVLDLRFDVGGDIDVTRALMKAIAERTFGRVYLLVGRYTFSAGIAAAAIVKHDGPRVTVIGEELGDNLRWWSEIDETCLPHTHLCLRGTHGLWDLAKGCKGEPSCYGDRYGATVGSLKPDIFAPLTARTWLDGRDPGLEAIRADLAKMAARPGAGGRALALP